VGCAERPAWQGQAEGYGRNAASDDVRRRTREIPFPGRGLALGGGVLIEG